MGVRFPSRQERPELLQMQPLQNQEKTPASQEEKEASDRVLRRSKRVSTKSGRSPNPRPNLENHPPLIELLPLPVPRRREQ